eukprot:7391719-Prymnesium_polylepis.2
MRERGTGCGTRADTVGLIRLGRRVGRATADTRFQGEASGIHFTHMHGCCWDNTHGLRSRAHHRATDGVRESHHMLRSGEAHVRTKLCNYGQKSQPSERTTHTYCASRQAMSNPRHNRPRRVPRARSTFRIMLNVNSGTQDLVVTGSTFNRATDDIYLQRAIDDFVNIAHGLVDSLMNNINSAPATVLSVKPMNTVLPTPFKLVLHAHEAFNENGDFVVTINHPGGSPIVTHKTYRQACMHFWSMMRNFVQMVAAMEAYKVQQDAVPVDNLVCLDTPTGVRLASLNVQM